MKVCVECGVVAAHWGRSVKLWQPHSSVDEYAYECERCSNDGVAYNEFKRGQCFELEHTDSDFVLARQDRHAGVLIRRAQEVGPQLFNSKARFIT